MGRQLLDVEIMRLPHGNGIPLPTYHSVEAAGMDLHAAVAALTSIAPGEIVLIPTGLAVAIPPGYEGQIRPRSGLAAKHGITLPNTPATIDADYRGELFVPLINLGRRSFSVERGRRIAQLLILPVPKVRWIEAEKLPPTTRGQGGFGHTGI